MNYPPEDEILDDEDGYYPDYPDDYDPDSLQEPGGRGRRRKKEGGSTSEKIVTVVSIIVAAAIGILILYLVIHTFDVFGPHRGGNMTEVSSGAASDPSAENTQVPNLLGKTENEAQALLKEMGLGYKYLGETGSAEYAAGQIAEQDTVQGTTVAKNTRIGYKISTGSVNALTVPDLTDKEQADAEQAITSMGLLVSVDNTRYSDTVKAGHVITTNPGAGSTVHEGDTVSLYISQGQDTQSVIVPDTVGKYKDDAVTMLTNSGLYVYVANEPSDTVAQNLVIRQDQPAGKSVQTGSSITITVSTGPENAIVINPDQNNTTLDPDAGSWMCYAQLQAPSGYTGGNAVRITLSQNGNETTVFEGVTDFPYLLNVEGAPGVSDGTAFVYLMDANGNILSTTRYDGIEFYEQ